MLSNFLQFIKTHQEDIVLVIGVILISLLSLAAGYITAKQQEKEPIQFEMHEMHEIDNPAMALYTKYSSF